MLTSLLPHTTVEVKYFQMQIAYLLRKVGKKNKPNQRTNQNPPPNFEQLLSDSFPSLTPLQNQDYIIEQVFQLSMPATTEIVYTKEGLMGSIANGSKPQWTHTHANTRKIKHKIHQQRKKHQQPPRIVAIPFWLIAELKLCMLLWKGYLRDAGRAVLALQLMLLKIQRKRAALQPARVTTTILHFLAPCTPNASCRRPAFLHFGPFSLSPSFLGGGGEEVKGAGLYLGVEANPPLRLLSLGLQQQGKSRYFSFPYFSVFVCVCLCLLHRRRERKKKKK